jgi:hypothetical protein
MYGQPQSLEEDILSSKSTERREKKGEVWEKKEG